MRITKTRRASAALAALGPAVTAGVEEEFHVVDLATRRLTGDVVLLAGLFRALVIREAAAAAAAR